MGLPCTRYPSNFGLHNVSRGHFANAYRVPGLSHSEREPGLEVFARRPLCSTITRLQRSQLHGELVIKFDFPSHEGASLKL